ncbi:MAG TPA: 1-(5-phosphoribosyl)-5-[(5-phosphoribosylamino)methylideneamino]imidazole-4-carboxamide isomerase [Syntrophomonadaceae bacterium]|nr:1-(5-phosphoribosyl)-5-[(5-phosphoribosylamino)methylideneamino]imidazole-4-carboxamide isomerase [Syntrophomonadaceae bacterium]
MILFPAIDIKDGQCVRLVQGRAEDKTVYSNEPANMAKEFENAGAKWLHIVDLDGAFSGKPTNIKAIEAIANTINIPFQIGGGLRELADVERLLKSGASRVIIGTKAVNSSEFIKELLDKFGPDQIVLGLDAKNGMVATEGWVNTTEIPALEFGKQMHEIGVKYAVYTDVAKDGLLQGPNFAATEKMTSTGLKIIASGGVSSIDDLKAIKEMEVLGVIGAIVGKAIYENKIDLVEALKICE